MNPCFMNGDDNEGNHNYPQFNAFFTGKVIRYRWSYTAILKKLTCAIGHEFSTVSDFFCSENILMLL
jgi:hypothetical protein